MARKKRNGKTICCCWLNQNKKKMEDHNFAQKKQDNVNLSTWDNTLSCNTYSERQG